MLSTLTKRQKEIFDYIKVYSQLNGYSPSLIDIKNHFQLSAISTVHEHIQNLKNKGYIFKEINQARSIRPIDTSYTGQDFLELPVIGSLGTDGRIRPYKEGQTMLINKNLVNKKGNYFIIKLIDSNIFSNSIKSEQTLIIFETDSIAEKDNCIALASIAKNNLAVGLLNSQNGNIFIKDLLNEEKIYRKFNLKGIVTSIINTF